MRARRGQRRGVGLPAQSSTAVEDRGMLAFGPALTEVELHLEESWRASCSSKAAQNLHLPAHLVQSSLRRECGGAAVVPSSHTPHRSQLSELLNEMSRCLGSSVFRGAENVSAIVATGESRDEFIKKRCRDHSERGKRLPRVREQIAPLSIMVAVAGQV